jgi:putative hemolysin
MDILFIVVLILLNGLFAMSEMAVSSSRKVRLLALQEAGEHGADLALQLLERPTQFLSTVQIGITSIGVLNGIVGEAAFSESVSRWLVSAGLSATVATFVATAIVVTLITLLTIVFGELVPKRIAQLYPETIARHTAPLMRLLGVVARPFIALLSASTAGVLHLMRMDTRRQDSVTEEEISASLNEGVHAGLIEHQEHQMVKNVFHLDHGAALGHRLVVVQGHGAGSPGPGAARGHAFLVPGVPGGAGRCGGPGESGGIDAANGGRSAAGDADGACGLRA